MLSVIIKNNTAVDCYLKHSEAFSLSEYCFMIFG